MELIGKSILLFFLVISFGLASAFANVSEPIDSLHFDSSDNSNFKLKDLATITSQENPSLKLNGIGDYLILNSNLPEKLKELSISVWVKPDYTIGAPSTLSIISESDAFNLSINNDRIDKNIAAFSVYDGIKWHKVQSKSEIKETWTHLVATYSDETITIFVNGVKENSLKANGLYSYTYTHGKSTQNSNDFIESKSNILVGAFTPLLRQDGVVKSNFSGLIDDVVLYSDIISPEQISKIYQNERSFAPQIIKQVQSTTKENGILNEYGFLESKNNLNDQKIESIASEGFKVPKKLSSSKNLSNIDVPKITIDPTDAPLKENTEESEKVLTTESVAPLVGSGKTTELCHIPSGNIDSAFTVIVFSNSVKIHLDHGDILGSCP